MKNISILTLTLFLSMLTNVVMAGTGSGKITHLMVHDKVINGENVGVIIFDVQNHIAPPACSSHQWAFDVNTAPGKAMYSLLLTAAAQGKDVWIYGADDCNAWGDRERPYNIYISIIK